VKGHRPHVLDVATGTADVALALAAAPPQPQVTGVDPSAQMLAHGRVKVSEQGYDAHVKLRQGDAQQLSGIVSFDSLRAPKIAILSNT